MKILLDNFVTKHFTWREMLISTTAIRLGLNNTPSDDETYYNIAKICEALEKIREHFNRPIKVNSGYRSLEVNQAIGGSKTSAHCHGLAADFVVQGISNIEVCRAIPDCFEDYDQIIYEFGASGWVHLGLSENPRHQILSAVKEDGKTIYKNGLIEEERG